MIGQKYICSNLQCSFEMSMYDVVDVCPLCKGLEFLPFYKEFKAKPTKTRGEMKSFKEVFDYGSEQDIQLLESECVKFLVNCDLRNNYELSQELDYNDIDKTKLDCDTLVEVFSRVLNQYYNEKEIIDHNGDLNKRA